MGTQETTTSPTSYLSRPKSTEKSIVAFHHTATKIPIKLGSKTHAANALRRSLTMLSAASASVSFVPPTLNITKKTAGIGSSTKMMKHNRFEPLLKHDKNDLTKYDANARGHIRKLNGKLLAKPYVVDGGYERLPLTDRVTGESVGDTSHRLVGLTFLGEARHHPSHVVDHVNSNRMLIHVKI